MLTKDWQDPEDGIEAVLLYWTVTRQGEEPRWASARPVVMAAQPGTYPVRRRCTLWVTPPFGRRVLLPVRRTAETVAFLVHSFFSVVQRGRMWSTTVSSQEIRSAVVTHSDPSAECTQALLHYSFDGPEHVHTVPMVLEGVSLRAQLLPSLPDCPNGGGSPAVRKRQARRDQLVARLPAPHVFHGRLWGPAETRVRYVVYFCRQGAYNPFSENGFWLFRDGGFWEVQL